MSPSNEPIYWGSYKGRIIKAIAVDGGRTWTDLQELTGFNPKTVNTVLAELFNTDSIHKTKDGEYRVAKDIYKQYIQYFNSDDKDPPQVALKVKEEDQKQILREFQSYVDLKKLQLNDNHIFLDGSNLEGLNNHLVENAQKELLIVNPFLGKTNILDSVRGKSKDGIKVKILTRSPSSERNGEAAEKKTEFVSALHENDIEIFLNDYIHAKIMVFDRGVAIISSMNLYPHSLAGGSWEAGIATSSSEVLNEILNVINSKIDDKETKNWV